MGRRGEVTIHESGNLFREEANITFVEKEVFHENQDLRDMAP